MSIHTREQQNTLVQQCINEMLLNRFIQSIDAKPKTGETYSRALRQFFRFLALTDTTQPSREDVLAFKEKMRQTLKPGTIQLYIIALRQFFRWTAQEGFFPNIAENIKGAKVQRGHKKGYLTSAQAKEMLSRIDQTTLQGARDHAMLALMLTTGLRTIEVARANVDDLRTNGESTILYIQGKGMEEKNEYVKVANPVEKSIRAYIRDVGQIEKEQPLFYSLSNKNRRERLTTRSISRIVKTRLKNAGYDDERLTAHSLRHTAGTLNLLNGGTLEETQQLLRHSNINTTMIYSHHVQRINNDSESRIAGAIFS